MAAFFSAIHKPFPHSTTANLSKVRIATKTLSASLGIKEKAQRLISMT
jgi:hypothetical protein